MSKEERNGMLIAMHKEGRTLKEMGQAAGMSASGVNKILMNLGYKKHDKRKNCKARNEKPEQMVFAEPRNKEQNKLIIKGKRYQDVTQFYSGG